MWILLELVLEQKLDGIHGNRSYPDSSLNLRIALPYIPSSYFLSYSNLMPPRIKGPNGLQRLPTPQLETLWGETRWVHNVGFGPAKCHEL
jgi:hypothetical protein